MSDSILISTKKALGLDADYTAFDPDVIMHINSVFSILNQLGVGPEFGFSIVDDSAVWDDFLVGDVRFNTVRTYVFLRVRLLFDPPTTSYLITALTEQYRELEWRMNVQHEQDTWVPPTTVVDGGDSIPG
jgi:hypothetical protein